MQKKRYWGKAWVRFSKREERPRHSMQCKAGNTAKDYASTSTIHGLSYIFDKDHTTGARIFWVVVVIGAIAFTTYQLVSLNRQWTDSPVITTLDTIALPIQDIEFPAVTICPQGSIYGISDVVLSNQMKEYMINKALNGNLRRKRSSSEQNISTSEHSNLTMRDVKDFLRDVYPGAKDKPTTMIKMLNSDEPKEIIQNEVIILPIEDEECDETSNLEFLAGMTNNLRNEGCPDGFIKKEHMGCLKLIETKMTYFDASAYCSGKYGAEITKAENFSDIKILKEQFITGMMFIN